MYGLPSNELLVLSLPWEEIFIFLQVKVVAHCLNTTTGKHACPSGQASGNEPQGTGVSLLYFPCCKVRQTAKEEFTSQPKSHLEGELGLKEFTR